MIDQLFKTPHKEKTTATINHSADRKLVDINQSVKELAKLLDRPVSIENFDEVKLHLRTELKMLATVIREMAKAMRVPDTLKVQGMPEQLKKLNAVLDYMENMQKLHDEIGSVTEALKQIDFSPAITVDAPVIPEIKIPDIKIPLIKVPKAEITVEPRINVQSPGIDIKALLKALKPLGLLSDKAGRPITVRMSDGKRFTAAIQQFQKSHEKFMQYVPGNPSLTQDEFKKTIRNVDDILAAYQIADKDNDATPNYYGFTNDTGAWYILEETVLAGADTFRYAKGPNDYTTNWTGRGGLSYDYFYTVF